MANEPNSPGELPKNGDPKSERKLDAVGDLLERNSENPNYYGDISNADNRFTLKLRALPEEYREMYAALSKHFLSKRGVRARIAEDDAYLYGHRVIARIKIDNKRLIMYLPGDARDNSLEVIIDTEMQMRNALSLIDDIMSIKK